MAKKKNSLEMLAQIMAQMAAQPSPPEKLPAAPRDIQTIYTGK